MASKLEDREPPLQEDLVYISDQSFHANDLRDWEARVGQALQFRLHKITPLHFLHQTLRAANPCDQCHYIPHPVLRNLALYLLELGRLSYALSTLPPSLLTAAAVYLARATLGWAEKDPAKRVDPVGYWTVSLEYYTGYTKMDLVSTVLLLRRYHEQAEGGEATASFLKYKRLAYHGVSLKTVRPVHELGLDEPVLGVERSVV
jgi:Cyclin, C-terminal domain/Cyclin, N-terminal domain